MMENDALPRLSPAEIRVLGVLIEKSRTTPDYYPMTLNAVTLACNQKTSRFPVVDYDEGTVMQAINSLRGMSLVATAVGGTSRTTKFKHNLNTVYTLSPAELAILCLLFLRGAQTPGELNTNAARLHSFPSLNQVVESLHHLTHLATPFVRELPKQPGQKEARFVHLMGDEVVSFDEPHPGQPVDLEARLAKVEAELAELKARLELITGKGTD
jgi:uncharacterized protein YceH (UPF0502 family)